MAIVPLFNRSFFTCRVNGLETPLVLRHPSRSLNEVTHAAVVTASKNTKEDDLQCEETEQTDQLDNFDGK